MKTNSEPAQVVLKEKKADSVAAIVVTYNRLSLLKECITALQAQSRPPDAIIVVNNGSTDGTEEWLRECSSLLWITQENRGGSFGFYTGIKTAYEKGYEWIWCMDDDGLPEGHALSRLLAFNGRKPCVMNALVLDKANHDRIVFQTGAFTLRNQVGGLQVVEGAANPYNSTFFHREVVTKAGLPRPDLTIWGDETEYFNRIKYRCKLPVFTVVDSLHYHPAQFSKFYRREWDLSFGWKVYFYVRNKRFVFASQYGNGLKALLVYQAFLLVFLSTILRFQRSEKKKKIQLFWQAAKDGLRKNTAKSMGDVRQLVSSL